MNENPRELEEKSVGTLFWSYSIPAIVATTAISLYNVIDRIFIGQGVGALAISGLALTLPLMNLAIALGTLVGAGAAAIVSIRMGEKRREDAICTLGNALVLNLIIGTLFSVLSLIFLDEILFLFGASTATIPFARDFMEIILWGNVITYIFFGLNSIMRASGYPEKAMISILLTVSFNVVLAPVFIFVCKWGIRGAAAATVLSQAVGMIWVLAHFISRKPYIRFRPEGFRLSASIVSDIFAIGMSPFLLHSGACLVSIIMNLQLGRQGGDMAIGAFGIINSIVGLIVMIVFGFTLGMQPIVGYNYGAGLLDRVVQAFKMTVLWATVISMAGFLVTVLFPVQIARAFTNDPHLINLTSSGMRIFMMAFPIVGFQIVTSNFFQSIGKAKIAIILSLSRQVICLIPFVLIFPIYWRLNGVWAASPASDMVSSLLTAGILFYYYRKLKKNTLHTVTAGSEAGDPA
ncbi:MAG: MATE family efflux transporter [Candidatus Eremiobacteraeota bacterium]|nr:MATE family efflux transporter [Candidatus Eremiobacteraeota bacterium]